MARNQQDEDVLFVTTGTKRMLPEGIREVISGTLHLDYTHIPPKDSLDRGLIHAFQVSIVPDGEVTSEWLKGQARVAAKIQPMASSSTFLQGLPYGSAGEDYRRLYFSGPSDGSDLCALINRPRPDPVSQI